MIRSRTKLVEDLAAEFPVVVHTAYHIQIETANGPHNVWFTKRDDIRLQLCGNSDSFLTTSTELFKRLRGYDYSKTDLAFMQSLTKFIGEIAGRAGIFVDAGWKDGKAKVAIVKSHANGDMDIAVRLVETKNSYQAECWAINKAKELYPGNETIFTDCQPAAANNVRVEWVPREQNKQADSLGNMRGAKSDANNSTRSIDES